MHLSLMRISLININMANYVAELKNDLPVSEVGGKAHSLSVLCSNGFNVPPGFVVTSSAFFDSLRHNDSGERIRDLASEITQGNFQEKSGQVREAVLKCEIPENIASNLARFLNTLHVKHVSVRSSAASEDSLRLSFAGLFDTFLNVKAEQPFVLNSVKGCWASLFNERAVAYRIRKGVPHLEGMAVIIQQMIPAEVSGTVFTAHPDTKDRNIVIIEGSWGLGEAVVSGLVTPDRYTVKKKELGIVERTLGRKKIMVTTDEDGTARRETPQNKLSVLCLDDSLIRSLTATCLSIERLFGHPQDIEWCIWRNKTWILQARPITGFAGPERS